MQLHELLPIGHVVVPLDVDSVPQAVDALVARLADAGAIHGADSAAAPDVDLRAVVPTDAAVIAHARTDRADQLVLALGVAPRPLDPAHTGLDGRPRIVALVLAPVETATLYLQTLSTVTRLLRDEPTVTRLLDARSAADVAATTKNADLRIQPELTVRDIMAPGIAAVHPDSTLRDAVNLMIRNHAAVIPVVGDKGEVLGTVTDRDVMRALLPKMPRAGEETTREGAAALRALHVRDVMSRSVLCISEDMGLDEVAGIVVNKDVAQLPVVNRGRLTGMLSRGDIIRKLFGR
jgi:CBS domain-containing protein/mannitol/fructose-specific phosphotransferase system IIA component (Ntr-type)